MKKIVPFLCGFLFLGASLFGTTVTWLPQAVRLDVNTPPWPYASSSPRIAASGDRVYVVWEESRYLNDPDDLPIKNIYISVSHDSGASWISAPIKLNSVLSRGNVSQAQLAACGDSVFVTWVEWRAGTYAVYFIRSEDAGLTWPYPPVRINHGHRATFQPRIACSHKNLVIAWMSQFDIFAERSLDSGMTWLGKNIRIDTGDPRGSAFSSSQEIACCGDQVVAVWRDRRNGTWGNVTFNTSRDGGETWRPSAVSLESDTSTGSSLHGPDLAASGNRIAVVWSDSNYEIPGVRINFSLDGGFSWAGEKILSPQGGIASRIAVEGETFHVLYLVQTGTLSNIGLWYLRGREPESPWSDPRRISLVSEYHPEYGNPVIRASGNRVYVVWGYSPDHFYQGSDIFFNLSTNHGRTWLDEPVRLDTGDLPGENDSGSPQLVCSGKRVHAVWSDMREGLEAIFYNTGLIDVPAVTLTITAGPGGDTDPLPGPYEFEQGTEVVITAEPDAMHVFNGWRGDICSEDASIRVELEKNTTVTAEFARIIHPPLNLTAGIRTNRSFLFTEIIHELEWRANPLNVDITHYRIYLRQGEARILLGEAAKGTGRFLCRNAGCGISVTYEVTAVDSSGREGNPARTSLNPAGFSGGEHPGSTERDIKGPLLPNVPAAFTQGGENRSLPGKSLPILSGTGARTHLDFPGDWD